MPRPALARIAPIKPRYLPLLAGFTITSTVLGLLTTPRSCPKATLWVGGTCFVNMAITTAAIVATSNMWNGTPEPPRRSPRA